MTDPACVPLNLFGYNAATNMDAVRGYISGTLVQDTLYHQNYAEANLTGEPFSTWAGPVSTAVGVSWRKDSVRQTSDPISQARDFDNQNPQPFAGDYNAKEIYAETVVPLLKDVARCAVARSQRRGAPHGLQHRAAMSPPGKWVPPGR